jgi:hypothetical protein
MQDEAQVTFCQRNHQVQALPPQCTQEPLIQAIGLRTPHGCSQHPEPQVAHTLVKIVREDTVAVMDEGPILSVGPPDWSSARRSARQRTITTSWYS